MSIEKLKKDIKAGKLNDIYLFYGQEEYLKRMYCDKISEKVVSEEFKQFNFIVMEGKFSVNAFFDASETVPVFAEKKLVLVKNSGLFKAKKADSKGSSDNNSDGVNDSNIDNKKVKTTSKSTTDQIVEYLTDLPSYTCIIFLEDNIDKRSKLYKSIQKNGTVVEFAHQTPADLTKWVMREFAALNIAIDGYTAAYLIEICEPDMHHIKNEIEKLSLYLQGTTTVSRDDIDDVCIKTIKSKIFDLTDAAAQQNTARALKLLDEMIQAKEPVPKIIFMINRQIRLLVQYKALIEARTPAYELAKKLGVAPFVLKNIERQAKGFDNDKMKKIMRLSLELDSDIKTGRINDRTAVEILIAEIGA